MLLFQTVKYTIRQRMRVQIRQKHKIQTKTIQASLQF